MDSDRDSSYQKLSQLKALGEVRILGILSPARTISTALSTSISSHPDVSAEVVQPFHMQHPFSEKSEEDVEARGYDLILRAYNEAKEVSDKRPVTIVVKEMARNFAFPGRMGRWAELSEKELLTVRNPLLTIESILRFGLDAMSSKPAQHEDIIDHLKPIAEQYAIDTGREATPEFFGAFLNIYAKDKGYHDDSGLGQHWKVMVDHAISSRDYTLFGDLINKDFSLYDLTLQYNSVLKVYAADMTNETARLAGFRDLDAFARSQGYRSWDIMKKDDGLNWNKLEPLLNVTPFLTGWHCFGDIAAYYKASDSIRIVDGSTLGAERERTSTAICEHLGLNEEQAGVLVDWSETPTHIVVEDTERSYVEAAFVNARSSTHLGLPTKSPVPPSMFPKAFQEHFSKVAMPAYIEALGDDRCIRPRGEELLAAMKRQVEGKALQDIDPVWAYSMISTDNLLESETRGRLLYEIRQGTEEFEKVFDLIDSIVRKQYKTKHQLDGQGAIGVVV